MRPQILLCLRHWSTLMTLFVVLLASGSRADVAPSNLLVNGSMELPAVPADRYWVTTGPPGLPGWRIADGTVDLISDRFWQPAPGQGVQCLDLVGESQGSIEQTFPTQPGRSYVLSAWLAHNPDGLVALEGRVSVYLNGEFLAQFLHGEPGATREAMQWVLFARTFQAAGPATTLRLSDSSALWSHGGAVLDGVMVIPNEGGLLVNGSFEAPDTSGTTDGRLAVQPPSSMGWRLVAGSVNAVSQRHWQPAPGQGRQSLDLAGTAGGGSLEQTLATEPGQVYVLTGWLSHHPGLDEGRAGVSVNGDLQTQLFHSRTLYGDTTPADMRWQPFSYPFLARAASTTLRLTDVTGGDAGGGLVLDGLDVSPAR